MQGHAHLQRPHLLPALRVQCPLGRHCGRKRVRRPREDRMESISRGFHHHTLVRGDGMAQDGVVASEDMLHSLGVQLPPLGAAFDVGEQERDRAGGQGHHCRFH
jgi:hypothetical protein